jgi:hypothetical protein
MLNQALTRLRRRSRSNERQACAAPGQFSRRRRNKSAAIAVISTIATTRGQSMIRKLRSGEYRLYSRKLNPKTGKRRNLGTFKSRAAAEKHERDVQYFKRH